MTWRELASYVEGFSAQARIRTVLNEGKPEPTGEQLLLADLFDMLQRLNWTLEAVNSEKGKPPKQPKPYPRWWLTKSSKSGSEDRVVRLEAARERKRARAKDIAEGRIA
ncbi:hypothetical protein ACIBEA_29750 [Streptomyces sp. NPDC051555]|uniref:hypothetical protein n=1 Tax=Streptomyces sp. NPDC051555 TaxID=3365657 RepID=UPI003792CAE5